MMFLDCPAYLDQDGAARCGLPAEVSCRFTMRSTEGPMESAIIRCPACHRIPHLGRQGQARAGHCRSDFPRRARQRPGQP